MSALEKQQSRKSSADGFGEMLEPLVRAVEQSADLVIITDRSGVIEYVNPAFEALTGYTRQEAIGRHSRMLKSGQHDKDFYEDLWCTIIAGEVYRGALADRKKNGEIFFLEKTITPVRDGNQEIVRFISNDRDVTDRKKLEAQLQQIQRMEALGAFAGGIAHDFNNLLMVMSAYAELPWKHYRRKILCGINVAEILQASRRATDLTRKLLAFSRKPANLVQSLDLNSVLRDLKRHAASAGRTKRSCQDHAGKRFENCQGRSCGNRTGRVEPGFERSRCHAERRRVENRDLPGPPR